MKNNSLVLLDLTAGFILLPTVILVKFIKNVIHIFYKPKREGRLLIKFLGGGNFIAISELINIQTTLVTVSGNRATIEEFLEYKKVYFINESNLILLLRTTIKAVYFVMIGSFKEVINLETESKFAKFLAVMASSDKILGITNSHKSILDFYLYDNYLVNPTMISKKLTIGLLLDFRLIKNNYVMASIKESQDIFIRNVKFKNGINEIAFAPSGSDTDTIRRLKLDVWRLIYKKLINDFPNVQINIYFQTINDFQYYDFYNEFFMIKNVKLIVDNYKSYLNYIKKSDLIVCIDSQTLHIANKFNIPVICFFGPSSPYAVGTNNKTYPISNAAACSPCRHKYFSVPCHEKAFCMEFNHSDLKIFDNLKIQ